MDKFSLDQVIKDRKWKEVTNCFKFAETTTSASYILRKYYVGLLYYFEQAYLHGKTGPLIPPPSMYSFPSFDWLNSQAIQAAYLVTSFL